MRTPCTLPLDPPLLSLVIARRAARTRYGEPAHRLPMNDQLALFLDGGVVIFTRSYSQANHTLNTLNSSYEPGYATLKGNTSKVFISSISIV